MVRVNRLASIDAHRQPVHVPRSAAAVTPTIPTVLSASSSSSPRSDAADLLLGSDTDSEDVDEMVADVTCVTCGIPRPNFLPLTCTLLAGVSSCI